MKPGMYIIFQKQIADNLSTGIKCAFAAHASMWLYSYCAFPCGNNDWTIDLANHYGEMKISKEHILSKYWVDWIESDYRKLVMTSPDTIGSLFEKFKTASVPVYLQRTSHKLTCVDAGGAVCLAVFCWKDEHKKLFDECELL